MKKLLITLVILGVVILGTGAAMVTRHDHQPSPTQNSGGHDQKSSQVVSTPIPDPDGFIAALKAQGYYGEITSPSGYDLSSPLALGNAICTGSASPMVYGGSPDWYQIVSLAQKYVCPETKIPSDEY